MGYNSTELYEKCPRACRICSCFSGCFTAADKVRVAAQEIRQLNEQRNNNELPITLSHHWEIFSRAVLNDVFTLFAEEILGHTVEIDYDAYDYYYSDVYLEEPMIDYLAARNGGAGYATFETGFNKHIGLYEIVAPVRSVKRS